MPAKKRVSKRQIVNKRKSKVMKKSARKSARKSVNESKKNKVGKSKKKKKQLSGGAKLSDELRDKVLEEISELDGPHEIKIVTNPYSFDPGYFQMPSWLTDIGLSLQDLLNESRILSFSYTPKSSVDTIETKNFSNPTFLNMDLQRFLREEHAHDMRRGSLGNPGTSRAARPYSSFSQIYSNSQTNRLSQGVTNNIDKEVNDFVTRYFIGELKIAISEDSKYCTLIILPEESIRKQIISFAETAESYLGSQTKAGSQQKSHDGSKLAIQIAMRVKEDMGPKLNEIRLARDTGIIKITLSLEGLSKPPTEPFVGINLGGLRHVLADASPKHDKNNIAPLKRIDPVDDLSSKIGLTLKIEPLESEVLTLKNLTDSLKIIT